MVIQDCTLIHFLSKFHPARLFGHKSIKKTWVSYFRSSPDASMFIRLILKQAMEPLECFCQRLSSLLADVEAKARRSVAIRKLLDKSRPRCFASWALWLRAVSGGERSRAHGSKRRGSAPLASLAKTSSLTTQMRRPKRCWNRWPVHSGMYFELIKTVIRSQIYRKRKVSWQKIEFSESEKSQSFKC